MERIKNIEFLRIIGCLSIILFHLFHEHLHNIFTDINIYNCLNNMACNGNKAVELFFILSGAFFVITYNAQLSIYEFIKKKIIRLSPLIIFCILFSFILSIFGLIHFKFYNNLLSLFFLTGTPISLDNSNIATDWYIGALFWTLLLFFYLKKNFSEKLVNLLIVIGVFISYSMILHTLSGRICSVYKPVCYICNIGMLRAIGGIGIGYLIGSWYKENSEKIKNMVVNLKTKIVLSIIELLCIGFIIKNLMLYNLKFPNQFIFVLVFALTTILFFVNKGYFSQYLNKAIFPSLAKYTYSLFLTHQIVLYGLKNSLWRYNSEFVYAHPICNTFLALCIILCVGILTYHFVEEPSAKYLKKKWV